ncbi:MAG: hypothetical protein ACK5Z2_12365 [Bacteroidota bacterium]|jgi:hypothetical protein
MPLLPKELLKSFFESGDRPSAVHFASLIDSMMHLSDDRHIIGLRVYESARTYLPGDATLFDNSLYLCIAETTGAFSPAAWQPVMSAGAVTYMGTWNAQTNTPALQSSTGSKGQYYVVTVSGTTNINGITDWQVGDWIINNGNVWQKVDNTDSGSSPTAAQVVFTPTGVITSANVQAAIEELQTWTASQLAGKTDAFSGQVANIVSFDGDQRPVDSGLSLDIVPRMNASAFTAGNFVMSDGTNMQKDSGLNTSSFLTRNNTEVYSPSADYHPATKKYVDDAAQLKLDKPTETIPAGNFLTLNASGVPVDSGVNNSGIVAPSALNSYLSKTNSGIYVPADNYHPATKLYVDEAVRRTLIIPVQAVATVTTTTWSRLAVIVLPDLLEMYPGVTTIGVRVRYSYRLAASTTADLALSGDLIPTPTTVFSPSQQSLAVSTNVFRTALTPEFLITNNASTVLSVVGRRPTGTGAFNVHAATLILRIF